MLVLFAATIISCPDVIRITNRIANIIGLSYQQKIELLEVISHSVPTCPIKIISDERPKLSN
jgi:hypothetical protein